MHPDDRGPPRWWALPLSAVLAACLTPACGPSDGSTSPTGAWVQLAAGDRHTCGTLDEGRQVWCWGANEDGQVGDGSNTDQTRPVRIFVPGVVVELSLGGAHSCARVQDGSVLCWGRNDEGQLGDGTTTSRSAAYPVAGLFSATAVSAGYRHTCAVEQGGRVLCWGANDTGQLGVGDAVGPDLCGNETPTPCSTAPAPVLDLSNGTMVAAGGDPEGSHSCAVDTYNRLWCWGANEERQLGDGTTISRNRPVQVTEVVDVRELSAGGRNTCAALGDQSAWCWGLDYDSPHPIWGLEGVVSVKAGRRFACARLEVGSLHCWGANEDGQLADGTQIDRVIPVTVGELVLTSMTLGQGHACAIDDGGLGWCWGRNAEGQLGATSLMLSTQPVQVGEIPAE